MVLSTQPSLSLVLVTFPSPCLSCLEVVTVPTVISSGE